MATGNIVDDTRSYGSKTRLDSDMATHISGGGTDVECGRGCLYEMHSASIESDVHDPLFARPISGDWDTVIYSAWI